MFDLNPDTVCFLIMKARVFHSKEGTVLPDVPNSPADDWARQVLADHADDDVLREFKATIDDLEPDQRQSVVALMWLGRGDFSVDEWEAALAEAAGSFIEATADYLIAHPMLADHLREGLDLLGYSCEA